MAMSFLTVDGRPQHDSFDTSADLSPQRGGAQDQPSPPSQWPLTGSPQWPLNSPQWPFEDMHSLVHPPPGAAAPEDLSPGRGSRVDTPEVYQLLFGNDDGAGSQPSSRSHSHRNPLWWT